MKICDFTVTSNRLAAQPTIETSRDNTTPLGYYRINIGVFQAFVELPCDPNNIESSRDQ